MANWTKHPILHVPSRAQLETLMAKDGPEAVKKVWRIREDAIAMSNEDPLTHGFPLGHWTAADDLLYRYDTLFVSGGNRSSKTEYGARTVVKAALANPNSEIVCFAQDNDASIRIQQKAIFRYLPPEFKKKQKGQVEYLNYTAKNGFTGGSLILPNGSKIFFHTYSQFISNRTKFEGYETGSMNPTWVNIGVWLDEYLEEGDLVKTFRFRLATRDSKMLLTFTPINGYTAFVAEFLKNAQTLETRPAELLGGKEVPFIQYSPLKEAGVIYFHSILNPFGGYERIAKELKNEDEGVIKTRAYGIPVKSLTTIFPLFTTDVHVIKDLPKITKDTHTVYQIIDPADARNFFCLWAAVDEHKNVTVLAEWPDRATYGEWAVTGEPKWKKGPASEKLGYAIRTEVEEYSYIKLFEEIEEDLGIEVYERIGDSRFMAVEHDNKDMFTDFDEMGMFVIPSDGRDEKSGIQMIDEWFTYNPNIELDSINKPKLHIHESCGNTIHSIINYSPEGKKAEALKDPIDCYDDNTEILTSAGWKLFEDLNHSEDVATMNSEGFFEWQQPTEYIEREYSGKMVCADTTRLSFCVTPNHRMVVNAQAKKNTIRLAKDLKRQDTIVASVVRKPSYSVSVDDLAWFEFLGWYLGDGCASGNSGGKIQVPGRGYSVYISQSRTANAGKCLLIEDCLNRLSLKWAYRSGSYVISSKALWSKVIGLGNCYTKKIPEYAFTASKEEIDAMLFGLKNSDGWEQDGKMRYASVSKDLTDGVQALLIASGRPSSTITRRRFSKTSHGSIKATKDQWWVSEISIKNKSLTNKAKEELFYQKDYSGMVYCVAVPNSTLIVRRKGKPMVCGNCLRYLRTANCGDGPEHYTDKTFAVNLPTRAMY